MLGDTIVLGSARLALSDRPLYMHVVQSGAPQTASELDEYRDALIEVATAAASKRALIDVRDAVHRELDSETRTQMWDLLLGARFECTALVVESSIDVTRLNMRALAQRTSFRAFESVTDAHHWIAGRVRASGRASSLPPQKRSAD